MQVGRARANKHQEQGALQTLVKHWEQEREKKNSQVKSTNGEYRGTANSTLNEARFVAA